MNRATKLWRGNRQTQRAQQAKLQEAIHAIDTYKSSPWVRPQHIVQAELKELLAGVDPYAIQRALDLRGWDIIGGAADETTDERERAVKASKWLYRYNPLAQWAIWLWTSWGMGDKVRVSVPDNEAADDAVDEFFTADRNAKVLGDDRIKELSRWLLVKGNRFFMFSTSTVDGKSTVRVITSQDEMKPLYNPHDRTDVWFYKRTWTTTTGGVTGTERVAFYPDWTTYFAGDKTDDETPDINERWEILVKHKIVTEDSTTVKKWDTEQEVGDGDEIPKTDFYIMWTAHNIKDEDSQWGWPLLTNPRAWLQAFQDYLESRLTLAKAATMYVRRSTVEGGSRAVKGMTSTIASNLSSTQYYDTNPPTTAGSTQVQNKAVETEDLPLITGAGDTASDSRTFSYMGLLGAGLFQTSAGMDTSRWATALEMDKAQSMLFEEYKTFWSAQFKRIAKIVLMAYEKIKGANFGDYTVVVSIDTFSLADFPAIARTIGGFVRDTITPLVASGTLDASAAMAIVARFYKMALDALGVEDAADLTGDEAFKLGDFAEEPEPEVNAEPSGVENDEEPGEEEPVRAVERVLENLRDGLIGDEVAREFVVGVLGDMAG